MTETQGKSILVRVIGSHCITQTTTTTTIIIIIIIIIIITRRKQEKEQDGATSNLSCTWLKKGEFKETEGLLTAAQEQALQTNALKAKIDKQAVSSKCRLCKSAENQ